MKKSVFTASPSGPLGRRYSNWFGGNSSGLLNDDEIGPRLEDGSFYSGGSSGGWTSQNTVDVINTGASTLQTILTSIFGRNNIQQANYASELYKQEQRTNTILWVILGLVLALGVVLVIRKTK